MQLARLLAISTIILAMLFASAIVAETPGKVDQREALALISRVGAKKPFLKASYQIGICIVGIEERETEQTLPGIMIEAYLRNSVLKKSFFIRYGAGSVRGLTPAIRLSAEMLIAELQGKRILQNKQSKAQYPLTSPVSNNLNNK
jgi:hypothetical protein